MFWVESEYYNGDTANLTRTNDLDTSVTKGRYYTVENSAACERGERIWFPCRQCLTSIVSREILCAKQWWAKNKDSERNSS